MCYSSGIRDLNALDGVLGRGLGHFEYEKSDLPTLAADYAHGIAQSHSFVDGNRRAAIMSAYVFLGLNGLQPTMTESAAIDVVASLASGKMGLEAFADYLREHMRTLTR